MNTLLAIGGAGAIGSMLRYLLGRVAQGKAHLSFPVGTLLVNVAGSLLVGVVARYFLNDETQPVLRAALIVGFCGGFTTFSAFSLETFGLIAGGAWAKAIGYVVTSTVLCVASTAAGYQLVLRR
jgi:CrcB protein